MELVYLWVEDYKNIYHQGFNFSPRFKCTYDEDKNELKIIDKEEIGEVYPKNFFCDNINVTAIVGENGSGKSKLLGKILDFPLKQFDYKICLYDNKTKQLYSNIPKSKDSKLTINYNFSTVQLPNEITNNSFLSL